MKINTNYKELLAFLKTLHPAYQGNPPKNPGNDFFVINLAGVEQWDNADQQTKKFVNTYTINYHGLLLSNHDDVTKSLLEYDRQIRFIARTPYEDGTDWTLSSYEIDLLP